MHNKTHQALQRRLKEEAGKLITAIRRSRQAEEEIGAENTEDPEDLAAISSDKTLLHVLHETDSQRLRSIQESLARMDSGQYGTCSQCGDDIGLKRLTAIPWAAYCLACQEVAETRQRLSGADVSSNIYAATSPLQEGDSDESR